MTEAPFRSKRRRLSEVQLDGGRRIARRVAAYLVSLACLLQLLAWNLPAHQMGRFSHNVSADSEPIVLVAVLGTLVCSLLLGHRGFGAGIAIAVCAAFTGFVAISAVFLDHLFESAVPLIGDHLYAIGTLGQLLLAIALFLGEWPLFAWQRRRLEHADPKLPTAIARR